MRNVYTVLCWHRAYWYLVLGVLVCQCNFDSPLSFFREGWGLFSFNLAVSHLHNLWLTCGLLLRLKSLSGDGSFGKLVCCRLFSLLFVQQRGKKTLLSLTLICHCHLVGMAKIVRGSTFGYDHETPLLDDLADLL